MNKYETALAHHHTYHLFGQLFLQGLTAELYPYLQKMSELAQYLNDAPDFDEAAAAHQTLFGFNIHPHESIFLSEDRLLGGEVAAAVQQTYAKIGYQTAGEADHIGRELGALAFLCAAEADAWEDEMTPIAKQIQGKQLTLLHNHVLRWLWPFGQAVGEHKDALYTAVVNLLQEVIVAHTAQLSKHFPALPADFALPAAPAILENEKTSLKDIARYLVTPVYSGFYLSRDMIGRFGRRFELPRGFGGREQMLTNLLRSAVQFDQLAALLEHLHMMAQRWYDGYQAVDTPAVVPFIRPWAERVQQTMTMLTEIEKEASGLNDEV